MGKGGQFTQSRSVGAPGSLHFQNAVSVKFLKFLENKRFLSEPSIAYGVAGNVVEQPICFRDVASKILQPSRIVFIKVKPCSCIPDSYDMEIPRGLG